jgi:hypothetical protein
VIGLDAAVLKFASFPPQVLQEKLQENVEQTSEPKSR